MDHDVEQKDTAAPNPVRIGLALSGGGFRASFYHLGTIRYLEEAGIMPKVEVMSTVSGGSIIGAYYLVQMEKKTPCRSPAQSAASV
jgi:predicted acylesterase/phospholipase RssA